MRKIFLNHKSKKGFGFKMLPKEVWWDPATATQKPHKYPRLVERKVCFISGDSNRGGEGWWTSVQRPLYPWQARDESFYGQNWGGGATCRNSTVISNGHLQLVISGLPNVILFVLGTPWNNGPFVPISLQSVLRIVAAHVLGSAWSSCRELLFLGFQHMYDSS